MLRKFSHVTHTPPRTLVTATVVSTGIAGRKDGPAANILYHARASRTALLVTTHGQFLHAEQQLRKFHARLPVEAHIRQLYDLTSLAQPHYPGFDVVAWDDVDDTTPDNAVHAAANLGCSIVVASSSELTQIKVSRGLTLMTPKDFGPFIDSLHIIPPDEDEIDEDDTEDGSTGLAGS